MSISWMFEPPPAIKYGCPDCQPCYGPPCECACHQLGEEPVDAADRLMRRFERQRHQGRLPRKEAALALEAVYGSRERRKIMKGKKS